MGTPWQRASWMLLTASWSNRWAPCAPVPCAVHVQAAVLMSCPLPA